MRRIELVLIAAAMAGGLAGQIFRKPSGPPPPVGQLPAGYDGAILVWSEASQGWVAAGMVWAETPAGTLNGSNRTFNLQREPWPQASLRLSRNGLLLKPGLDYSVNGRTVTFIIEQTPQPGDVLVASYMYR